MPERNEQFSRLMAAIRSAPFSPVIRRDLEELACLHRIGTQNIPLKEVPSLSPFVGVGIRHVYDFRLAVDSCMECGKKSETIICGEACMRVRAYRIIRLGMCALSLVSNTVCNGEIYDGYCRLHKINPSRASQLI
jgi:hypothetical protein